MQLIEPYVCYVHLIFHLKIKLPDIGFLQWYTIFILNFLLFWKNWDIQMNNVTTNHSQALFLCLKLSLSSSAENVNEIFLK